MPSYPRISGSGWPGGGDGIGPDGNEQEPAGRSGTPAFGSAEHDDRDAALVGVVLDEMSPADQEILRLAFGLELGAAEIAVNLGTSIRRAQADLQAATSRFEARSIALAITSRARVDCDVPAALIPDASAGHISLTDRHCKLVADHRASCTVCQKVLASWSLGSELFGTLAQLTIARTTPIALIDPHADRPRRFWEKNPALIAFSGAAVLIIAVAAIGVSKLVAGQQQVSAGPAASRAPVSRPFQSPSPSSSPRSSPAPTKSPAPPASHNTAVAPPVTNPAPRTTSPAPNPDPPPTPAPTTPSPTPAPTSPSPTPAPTSPPPSPGPSPS
jgi:hypothetical protein